MKLRVQFAGCMIALGISAGLALPCAAQQPRNNDRPQKQQAQPRQEHHQERRQDRPARTPSPQRERAYTPPPRSASPNMPQPRSERAYTPPPRNPAGNNSPAGPARAFGGGNRPPNASVRPRDLSPEERQRLQQNERRFSQLTPQQRDDMRRRAEVWQRMTPEQQMHIKDDVLPKWRQMPPDRQRAIQHRLGVLQNMPESARNQHLSDPNFTRGMSEEDKQMLRDLSHQHVGGPPDPPNE
jgi:Protein of unknown function (DUF3106)